MPTTSLLIKNIHTLVLMDAQNQVLRGAHLYAENGEIRRVGSGTARLPKAGRDRRASLHRIAWPGQYASPPVSDAHPRLRSGGRREALRLEIGRASCRERV